MFPPGLGRNTARLCSLRSSRLWNEASCKVASYEFHFSISIVEAKANFRVSVVGLHWLKSRPEHACAYAHHYNIQDTHHRKDKDDLLELIGQYYLCSLTAVFNATQFYEGARDCA